MTWNDGVSEARHGRCENVVAVSYGNHSVEVWGRRGLALCRYGHTDSYTLREVQEVVAERRLGSFHRERGHQVTIERSDMAGVRVARPADTTEPRNVPRHTVVAQRWWQAQRLTAQVTGTASVLPAQPWRQLGRGPTEYPRQCCCRIRRRLVGCTCLCHQSHTTARSTSAATPRSSPTPMSTLHVS